MKNSNIIVITGTDTGVGKTWAGCALSRALQKMGHRVLAVKPLETGCEPTPQDSEDGVALANASGQSDPTSALLRFRDPVAASEAADREDRAIDFDGIVRTILEYSNQADLVLVEGAGGLLAPLTWEKNVMDLALALNAPMLVVASDRLGTINHTLMTLNLLKTSDLEIVGVVLTAPETPDFSTGSNAASIARLAEFSRITCVPRTTDLESMSRSMQEVVGWIDERKSSTAS